MNYYDVFGVSPTATPEVINATHKALAKMYHPDINSSQDAHERMAMLNEANEVLSDSLKREMYDNELRQNQELFTARSVESEQYREMVAAEERAEKAELLRRKAEERLRTEDATKKQRKEQAQRKAEEADRKKRQAKIEYDKRYVTNVLSALVMNDNTNRYNKTDVDEERYYATKVLLSMVRNDDKHLRKMAEEAERKQRIEEILALVKEYNDKKD